MWKSKNSNWGPGAFSALATVTSLYNMPQPTYNWNEDGECVKGQQPD